MNIPYDILRYEIWKSMSYNDLLNYCATNKIGREVCDDPETWRFQQRNYRSIYKGGI